MPYSPKTHRSVSTWFPIPLLERLDRHLAERCALPGQRASRQDWILATLKAALDASSSVEGAVIAAMRARAAEAAVLDAAEAAPAAPQTQNP